MVPVVISLILSVLSKVETLGTCQQGCDSGCRSRGIRCSITWPSQGCNFARYEAHAQSSECEDLIHASTHKSIHTYVH